MEGKSRKFIQRLTKKYRLTINDKQNFKEVYVTSVSKLKFGLYNLLIFILGALIVILFVFYTPLRQLVPGYPADDIRKIMYHNSMMIDSMQQEILLRDDYLSKIQLLIQGEIIEDTSTGNVKTFDEVNMLPMNDDSIFDHLIGPDKYKFSYLSSDEDISEMTRISLFVPTKGVVINKFGASIGHFGTDIVGKENTFISAVLDGTVVFAEWSVSTGYVVQIQHNFNLISIYKHNSDVSVKAGDQVKAGDIIAIMGNEGEYSTGPHLHFELWQNGVPLDPEKYITF